MNEYLDLYIAEAKELLDEMNNSLLELEKNTEDADLINSIFRTAHTIKGNSAAMEFKNMEKLTHGMENILQDLREGKAEVDGKIMELLYVCHDFLESNLCTIMETGSEEEMKIDEILSKLHLVIEEKHEMLNSEDCPVSEVGKDCRITLSEQDAQSLREQISAGSYAYLICIQLAEDCAFRSVRVWMWFQEIGTYLSVIKSDLEMPGEDDLTNNRFVFDSETVSLLAVSEKDIHQLAGLLEKLQDVKRIKIELLKTEKIDLMKNPLEFSMSEAALTTPDIPDGDAGTKTRVLKTKEIEDAFTSDFIGEISAQIIKLEAAVRILSDQSKTANAFHKILRVFHTVRGLASFISSSQIAEIAETSELLIEHYIKENFRREDVPISFFIESSDMIRKLCDNNNLSSDRDFSDQAGRHIHNMRIEIQKVSSASEEKAPDILTEEEKAASIVLEGDHPRGDTNVVELLHSKLEKQAGKSADKSPGSSFMRVSTQKLDNLVDMLGELLIMHSVMQQEASERFDSNDAFMNNLLRMTKSIKGIQNLSMSLRMVALKQVFQNTMRVGRDTAAELEKKVEISIKGEETEIDRNIADKLSDPLMHLIRNAVAHGIESEAERIADGKPQEGHVTISAYSKKGYVYIEVEDDGKGLSLDKIRAKAAEKKLIVQDCSYTDEEIMKFIFLPGFSTQETIDKISGRGVGMNVVETEIKKVGGKIDIDSRPGGGSRFILKIPLNLSVMNGTIVDINGGRYIIPTLFIKQFLKPDAAQWVNVKNKKSMVRVRDELVQVIHADKIFGKEYTRDEEDESMVVIVEVEQKFKAIPVRSVIGRQEIVAKPLDREFGRLDYASGASILGDGKISLILDVEAIFNSSN